MLLVQGSLSENHLSTKRGEEQLIGQLRTPYAKKKTHHISANYQLCCMETHLEPQELQIVNQGFN
jgi:hypothetical protein